MLQAHFDPGCGGIEQVDGLIGKLSSGDELVAEFAGGLDAFVADLDAMELFVLAANASKHGGCGYGIRFADNHLLEASSHGGVFFEIFPEFRIGRRGETFEFAPSEFGLQQVRSVVLAFLAASPYERMGFIDEKNNGNRAFLGFFQDVFQAVLEFAANASARLEETQIEGPNLHVLEHIWNLAFSDFKR